MAYSQPVDLLTGDIPLAGKYGDGTALIQFTADEIDAMIGHIYVTPIVFVEDTVEQIAAVRPAKLLLKKINTLLASGRIIMDQAVGGEDDRLQTYGKSLYDEAMMLLTMICDRKIILTDAPVVPDESDALNTGPSMVQEDDYSLVQAFYDRVQNPLNSHSPVYAYKDSQVP